jgi:hypothetical protein
VEIIAPSTPEGTDETEKYTEQYTDTDFETVDWTDATHSKSADPDFAEVFDATMVKRIDFVITPERWQSMLDNMTELYGEFGQNSIPDDPGMGEDGTIPGEEMPISGEEGLIPGNDGSIAGGD